MMENIENTRNTTQNTENAQEVPPHLRVDPIIDFLSKVVISDLLINDMAIQCQTLEGFKRYYRATDLFIIRDILTQVDIWEPEHDNPNYIAFRNLMKWFMYLIVTHPWWHRKLCYYNRMMGTNTHSSSYYRIQYHPAYIPGAHWSTDNQDKGPEEFNSEQMPGKDIYKWIDQNITNKIDVDNGIDDEEILNLENRKKVNPIRRKKKRRNFKK